MAVEVSWFGVAYLLQLYLLSQLTFIEPTMNFTVYQRVLR